MRQCPLCSRLYDNATEFCPQDGRVLFLPDPLLGSVLDGKYSVDALLGSGGQGAVYRATHVHLQRTAALKVVRGDFLADADSIERFKREALAVARLKSPYVVTIHDFGITAEGGAYIVMEYLIGHSLCHEIRRCSRVPVGPALELMRRICAGVHAAHEQGIIHRDLKPDNIFLEMRDGRSIVPKILDFGIAKLWDGANLDGDRRDETGGSSPEDRVFGTAAYMSPEQSTGQALDARADIYSLGCVFYEMITGRPPFLFTGAATIGVKHLRDTPRPPSVFEPGIPDALDAALLRALAKSRDERFQTAEEFGRALDAVRAPMEPRTTIPGASTFSATYEPGRSLADPFDVNASRQDRAAVVAPNNLPQPVTTFIGRENEIAVVTRLLSTNRLVTLTGPGGCGKTRLSIEVAGRMLPSYPDGVWLVELAALADLSLVPQAVASVLGVNEESRQPLVDALVDLLRFKRTLLVLDNCEHLASACAALVSTLLRECRFLRVLASSQHGLGALGETTWPVFSLSLPNLRDASVESIEFSEAVRLFVDRARMGNPGFALSELTAPVVADICHQLDGMPLAIELAAARVKLLSVEQIAERLDDRFRLLIGGNRAAQAHQKTLEGALDWSYDLLSGPERTVFNRLSVFAAGFTLEAAEAVGSEGGGRREEEGGRREEEGGRREEEGGSEPRHRESADPEGQTLLPPPSSLLPHDVLELLSNLVDKSLVVVEQGEASRYRLLETLRQYGARKLQDSGEAALVRTRHRGFFLALAEQAQAYLSGPAQGVWLERLELEHDNLRAALEWSKVDAGSSDALLRLAGALAKFWHIRGHDREGRAWLEEALSTSRSAPVGARAKALDGAGVLARVLGDYGRAVAYHRESLALRREANDARGAASSLNNLGFVAQWQGDYAHSANLHTEALALAREAGDRSEIANSLNYLGIIARYHGDAEKAILLFEESLGLFRKLGDEREIANTLNNLAVIRASQGNYERASVLFEENLRLRRRLGDRWGTATSLNNLGQVALLQGDLGRAASLLKEGLTLYAKAGDQRGVAYSLEGFVSLAAALGQAEEALHLAGATAALREALGAPLSPAELAELDRQLEKPREDLGPARAEQALAAGRAMAPEQALAYALTIPTNADFRTN